MFKGYTHSLGLISIIKAPLDALSCYLPSICSPAGLLWVPLGIFLGHAPRPNPTSEPCGWLSAPAKVLP